MGDPHLALLFLASLEVSTIIYILPRNVFVFLLHLVAEGLGTGVVITVSSSFPLLMGVGGSFLNRRKETPSVNYLRCGF